MFLPEAWDTGTPPRDAQRHWTGSPTQFPASRWRSAPGTPTAARSASRETGVHRDGSVRGVRRRAVVGRVVLEYPLRSNRRFRTHHVADPDEDACDGPLRKARRCRAFELLIREWTCSPAGTADSLQACYRITSLPTRGHRQQRRRGRGVHSRILSAAEGTEYRLNRTESGFELTVDVHQPFGGGRRAIQMWTYNVVLNPESMTYTMEDVVRERVSGLGGSSQTRVSVGRKVVRASSRSLDGQDRHSFSSADGHRLIRDTAAKLGWHELQPQPHKEPSLPPSWGWPLRLAP